MGRPDVADHGRRNGEDRSAIDSEPSGFRRGDFAGLQETVENEAMILLGLRGIDREPGVHEGSDALHSVGCRLILADDDFLDPVPRVADFDGDRPVVPESVAFSPDDAGV